MLLTMSKYSVQDTEAVQKTCFKLNSLQLHTLLTGYLYAPEEPRIPLVNTCTPVHLYLYIYTPVQLYLYTCTSVHIYLYTSICIPVPYTPVHLYLYIYTPVHLYLYTCTSVHISLCTCAYTPVHL